VRKFWRQKQKKVAFLTFSEAAFIWNNNLASIAISIFYLSNIEGTRD